jgi:hypothetical protein
LNKFRQPTTFLREIYGWFQLPSNSALLPKGRLRLLFLLEGPERLLLVTSPTNISRYRRCLLFHRVIGSTWQENRSIGFHHRIMPVKLHGGKKWAIKKGLDSSFRFLQSLMLVSPSAIYYITILWKPLSNNTRGCCN